MAFVLPPAPEQAGAVWELVGHGAAADRPRPGTVIVTADPAAAQHWALAAPAPHRVHPVTGLGRTAKLLKDGRVAVLAGAAKDLAALVARSALKLESVETLVLAWPEGLAGGEHADALDALLAEAREARRVVLTWNPVALRAFLERHAHHAQVVGRMPLTEDAEPLPPVGPARYVVVPPSRRPAVVADVLDAVGAGRPFVWSGGPIEAPAEPPDTVVCTVLPARDELGELSRWGPPVVLVTPSQLAYLRSIAAPLEAVPLPSAADRARDRVEALRADVARVLERGDVDAELALLEPLFERFDPAEVAAALLALSRQQPAAGHRPETGPVGAPTWVRVFVNVGKKDRAGAKDLVGALIREVGLAKGQIGRIEVRETSSVVEIAADAAERAVRGLAAVTIKGRRAAARVDRA